jgi:hypothetical protein
MNAGTSIHILSVSDAGKAVNMDLKDRVAMLIDYIAEINGLSDPKIARIVGSKTVTIRRYRTKQTAPRTDFIDRFCSTFGIRKDFLVEGSGEPFEKTSDYYSEDGPAVGSGMSDGAGLEMLFENKGEAVLSPGRDTGCDSGESECHDGIPGDDSTVLPENADVDTELSLQKLALLAGIKIDRNWVVNLADVIGIAPWKISLSILNLRVDDELMEKIETCGYFRNVWAVKSSSEKPMGSSAAGLASISELIKIAEEILQSGTIHASSLAMVIVSLKAASADRTDDHSIKGGNAINGVGSIRVMG